MKSQNVCYMESKKIKKTHVVLVTYGNRYLYFLKLIDMLLLMGVGKIIVVDNNSHIESKRVLYNYYKKNPLRLQIVENEKNLGSAIGFAQGIKAAMQNGAEFIWLLDDDLLPDNNSLIELFFVWDKINIKDKEAKLMLLSNRIDRSNIYIDAVRYNKPELVLGTKNRFRSFNMFHFFKSIKKKFYDSKIYSIDINKHKIPEYGLIGAACYGGMFFHKKLVENIGLPDESYVLYYDDYDFSLRHRANNGYIYLATKSILRDQIKSWNNFKWKFAFIEIAKMKNKPVLYYSVRNNVYFEKKFNVDNKIVYYINMIIYSIFTCIASVVLCNLKNCIVYWEALRDGLQGKMGINSKYLLS